MIDYNARLERHIINLKVVFNRAGQPAIHTRLACMALFAAWEKDLSRDDRKPFVVEFKSKLRAALRVQVGDIRMSKLEAHQKSQAIVNAIDAHIRFAGREGAEDGAPDNIDARHEAINSLRNQLAIN